MTEGLSLHLPQEGTQGLQLQPGAQPGPADCTANLQHPQAREGKKDDPSRTRGAGGVGGCYLIVEVHAAEVMPALVPTDLDQPLPRQEGKDGMRPRTARAQLPGPHRLRRARHKGARQLSLPEPRRAKTTSHTKSGRIPTELHQGMLEPLLLMMAAVCLKAARTGTHGQEHTDRSMDRRMDKVTHTHTQNGSHTQGVTHTG